MADPMSHIDDYQVAASAQLQVRRLSADERRLLSQILTAPDGKGAVDTQRMTSGRFVSRLNGAKRVLWTQDQGIPTVLSIVDGSYSSDR